MKNKKGFTLAEVLIALTVIGIIAAITINIIATNSRRTEIETKLKKTVSILNGAIYRATIDYGQPSGWPELKVSSDDLDQEFFMQKYLIPYLIVTKPFKNSTLKDLGYNTDYIKTPSGGNFGHMTGTSYRRIFLNDGTVILRGLLTVGNSFVFLVDINGPKGPNVAGKDVFQLSLEPYSNNQSVQAYGVISTYKNQTTGEYMTREPNIASLATNCQKDGNYCSALIQKNGWKIPSDYPVKI